MSHLPLDPVNIWSYLIFVENIALVNNLDYNLCKLPRRPIDRANKAFLRRTRGHYVPLWTLRKTWITICVNYLEFKLIPRATPHHIRATPDLARHHNASPLFKLIMIVFFFTIFKPLQTWKILRCSFVHLNSL